MLKSASLRGSQVWGRRSERQAGDVTSEMAVTDEFTCGHKKRAFQEDSASQRLRPRKSPRASRSWIWSAFVGKALAPGSGSKGLVLRLEGGRNSLYTPRKTPCREFRHPDQRNLGTSHTPTAQLEGDVSLQGG